jgi:undecaprenyl-diphosphatase
VRFLLLVAALIGPLLSVDAAVQQAVQDTRRPWLEPVMRGATDIGKPAVVLGGLLAIAVLQPATGVATARLALVTLIPTNMAVEGLKRLTQRTRPDGGHNRNNSSFPSSHAANAFALAAVFARRWPRRQIVFWLLAAIVAFSRIYLNRHYLSDVLGAAVIGWGCAWAVQRWLGARLEVAAPDAQPVVAEPRR